MSHSTALSEAISNLVAQHPFFATVLYSVMDIRETTEIDTAATDGYRILVNPKFFARKTLHERVFVLAHEVMHAILRHMPRAKLYRTRGFGPDLKPFDDKTFNVAADYVINFILSESKVGVRPNDALYDPYIATSDSLVDDVYLKVKEQQQDQPENDDGEGQSGEQGHGNFDEHLEPEDSDGGDTPNETDVKTAVQQGINAAKAMGKLPASLEAAITEALEPALTWRDHLETAMTAKAGYDITTWSKPNRRRLAVFDVYTPSHASHAVGPVVVVVDSSGSVSDAEVGQFLAEIRDITTGCRPEWLKVVWCDAKVQHVDDIDEPDDLDTLKRHGCGGTDMGAALAHIAEQDWQPDTIVVLTDGFTPWGQQPDCDVIWGVTCPEITAPYGQTIHVSI